MPRRRDLPNTSVTFTSEMPFPYMINGVTIATLAQKEIRHISAPVTNSVKKGRSSPLHTNLNRHTANIYIQPPCLEPQHWRLFQLKFQQLPYYYISPPNEAAFVQTKSQILILLNSRNVCLIRSPFQIAKIPF